MLKDLAAKFGGLTSGRVPAFSGRCARRRRASALRFGCRVIVALEGSGRPDAEDSTVQFAKSVAVAHIKGARTLPVPLVQQVGLERYLRRLLT